MSPAHSIISSRLLLPFYPAAAGSMCPAKREQRRRKRDGGKNRRMERQEEERMRAYIKAAFTDICALGAERPYEYQYEPMERKHSPFFPPSHWAIHAHKKSIQVSVMASLWACARLCEQCCFASTVSLSWLWLVLVKNTLCQVQLWWALQYVNQVGLNRWHELQNLGYS